MNATSPYILYITNKHDFLQKVCSLCLSTLFYPEIGDKMVSCCRLQCRHTFHEKCMEQMIAYKHNKCPECRESIISKLNVDKSLELAIRDDAFDNNNVDEIMKAKFIQSRLQLDDYPYHKAVFERWRTKNYVP